MTDVPLPTSLVDLIETVEARNDWSDRAVARNFDDAAKGDPQLAGLKLTPSDITAWRKNGMKTFVPGKIRALAAGLRVPDRVVAIAVLRDMGFNVAGGQTLEDALRSEYGISDKGRRMILAMLAEDRKG